MLKKLILSLSVIATSFNFALAGGDYKAKMLKAYFQAAFAGGSYAPIVPVLGALGITEGMYEKVGLEINGEEMTLKEAIEKLEKEQEKAKAKMLEAYFQAAFGDEPCVPIVSVLGALGITEEMYEKVELEIKEEKMTLKAAIERLTEQEAKKLEEQEKARRFREDLGKFKEACRNGNLEGMKALATGFTEEQLRSWVNAEIEKGWTCLMQAIAKDRLDIVKFLIENGADINFPTIKEREGHDISGYWEDISRPRRQSGILKGFENYQVSEKCTPLMIAAIGGNVAIVSLLLENVAIVDAEDNIRGTALFYAVKKGNFEIVKLLLEKGADVNKVGLQMHTPLIAAAVEGELAIAQLLVECGANIKAKDNRGNTPIMHAIYGGHFEVVHFLLEKGADLDEVNTYGMDVVEVAQKALRDFQVDKGNFSDRRRKTKEKIDGYYEKHRDEEEVAWRKRMVSFVNRLKSDKNLTSAWKNILFVDAAWGGYKDRMAYWIQQRVDVNGWVNQASLELCGIEQTGKGDHWTALMYVARLGNIPVARFLVEEYGADVNAQGISGWTPLTIALYNDKSDMAQELINMGADVSLANESGMSPFLLAARGGYVDLMDNIWNKLSEDKRKLALKTEDKEYHLNPLMRAAKNGHLYAVKRLLELGADVNAQSEHGHTALMLACWGDPRNKDPREVVKYLVETAHADVQYQTLKGRSALTWAADNKNEELVEYLLKQGAADGIDEQGRTFLMRYVGSEKGTCCKVESLQFLMDHGCELKLGARDKNGWSALMYAILYADEPCIGFLRDKMKEMGFVITREELNKVIEQARELERPAEKIQDLEEYMSKLPE